MAKCKQCNATIPDGTDICANCLDKEKIQTNESYLDSLLNSVKNSAPGVEEIYKKKNTNGKVNSDNSDEISHSTVKENESDTRDELPIDYTVDLKEFEDLFDLPFDESASSDENSADDLPIEDMFADAGEDILDESMDEGADPYDVQAVGAINNSNEMQTAEDDSLDEEESPDDFYDEDGSINYEKLLGTANLDSAEADGSFSDTNTDEDLEYIEENSDDDDILSLLNIISPDDPVSQDAKAIGEMLSEKDDNKKNLADIPTVGEVFSDALKVVTSLNDPDLEELDIPDQFSTAKQEKTKAGKKSKKEEKEGKKERATAKKKDRKSRKAAVDDDKTESVSGTGKKPGKGLIKRLFANVPDEKAAKRRIEQELAAGKTADVKPKKGLAKLFKGKNAATDTEGDEENTDIKKKKASAEAKKAEKKEKKRKKKEIIEVIDEIDEDESRINRIGAGIVFVFFGLIALLLIAGTNMVSYSLSIQHATDYFDKQKYNEAYNEVYGIDFKDEDMVIYDKIMTVMFVNKQLNSYNNYYYLGKYPEALDSLLKGLGRYNKHIEFATMIGIKPDMDYVREQILAELKTVFNISEEEAMEIIAQDDMEAYSQEVYKIIAESMNN